jgi:hypothetical protein
MTAAAVGQTRREPRCDLRRNDTAFLAARRLGASFFAVHDTHAAGLGRALVADDVGAADVDQPLAEVDIAPAQRSQLTASAERPSKSPDRRTG